MGLMDGLYGLFGYYNQARRNNDEAIKWYKKADHTKMTNTQHRMAYGVLLLRSGEFEKSREVLGRVLVHGYHNPKKNTRLLCKMNLALAYWKLDDLDIALELCEEVYRKIRNTRLYGIMGYLLIENGDMERAEKVNLEAYEYDDEDPVIIDNLGQYYDIMGDKEKAEELYRKALKEKSNQVCTLYALGKLLVIKGENDEAREHFEMALKQDINPMTVVEKKDIEAALAELDS